MELTKVVVRFVPLHCTTELDVKLVPVTVSVVLEEPTVTEVTEIDVRVSVLLPLEEPLPHPETATMRARMRPGTTARRWNISLPNRDARPLGRQTKLGLDDKRAVI